MTMDVLPDALHAALAQFHDETRLYALEASGNTFSSLLVERWSGWDALDAGFRYTLDCLSTDATLPLAEMLGQPVTLKTRLADGDWHTRTGLVTEAECTGADGGLARYRLRLVPWIHLLAQSRQSRLYQDMTALQIVEAVFARHAPFAAWRVTGEVGPFMADARVRSNCAQYRESDWEFITRLLAEEGLGFYIEDDPEAPAGHGVVVFADSSQASEERSSAAGNGIRFHRDAATEASDAVQGFGAQYTLGSTGLVWLSQDYKAHRALGVQTPLDNAIESVRLELYDPAGPHAFADEAQARRYLALAGEAHEARQQAWLGLGSVRSFRSGNWFRLTHAPDDGVHAGPPEVLLAAVRHEGENNLPDALVDALEAGLAGDLVEPVDALDDEILLPPDLAAFLQQADDPLLRQQRSQRAGAVGYACTFHGLPRSLPWRPVLADGTGARWNPRPTVNGPQTAVVVGPDGETSPRDARELYCDRLGRVRLRLRWQGDVPATAWVRVAQRQASPGGVGMQWLPRIGTEVVVVFIDNDVDRPLVLGGVYDGQGEGGIAPTPGGEAAAAPGDVYALASDHVPSAQGNLAGGHAPPWHGAGAGDDAHRNAAALGGVKSREFGGTGSNQLVFDDSDGQLRVQFATTHATSQFNAGHLLHQADNFRGSFRGQGWELRTDAYGALRARSGLWVSTYAIDAADPAGEPTPATALLKQAVQLVQTFDEAASTHHTVGYSSHRGIGSDQRSKLVADTPPVKGLLASMQAQVPGDGYEAAREAAAQRSPAVADGHLPHSGDALVGFAAKAGLGLVAGQSLQWLAGETLTLASGGDTSWAISGDLRVHTGQAIGLLAGATKGDGLRLIAGKGPVDAQARQGQLRLRARDQLRLVSATAAVELAAGKRVVLKTAGGASLVIEGGGMTWACPGEIRVHASNYRFDGPAQLSREMNTWPETDFNQRHVLRHRRTGEPLRNMPVEITRGDGARMRVTTDGDGRLPLQQGLSLEEVVIKVLNRE